MHLQHSNKFTAFPIIFLGLASIPAAAVQPGAVQPGAVQPNVVYHGTMHPRAVQSGVLQPDRTRAGFVAGGVLETSYGYHRAAAQGFESISRDPGLRYSYGFPVATYRWGWFGASRYYPRSFSHHGYNGDQWHWAYRRGY